MQHPIRRFPRIAADSIAYVKFLDDHVGVEFLRIGQSDRAAIQTLVAASGAAA